MYDYHFWVHAINYIFITKFAFHFVVHFISVNMIYIIKAFLSILILFLFSSLLNAVTIKTSHKPPNILVRTEDSEQFVQLSNLLNTVLDPDRYTIHKLSEQQFLKTPWKDSCCLLMFNVDNCKSATEQLEDSLKNFLLHCDGRVIFYSFAEYTSCSNDLVDFLKSENLNGMEVMKSLMLFSSS